ncbi:hypothetical protein PR202_ga13966 [Eleusine coracana subsp. coracana]|uniref:HMA domain-containing protein n=1 Tax=Eleusine coracana subsp. coracana TaxID=191504 RepID=A0AAV5CFL0_ELECO|nr:hypothetical protein QOZ80_3AG0210590 [Eleusine coracana subsp. coracana]GJM97068.1 hypothetical protein PR202_ga13966 [Eleusine coracana subsp. coracana]
MAPLLFRDLKNLSCSSPAVAAIRPSLERRLSCSNPASTAICPNLERQPMMVRSHRAIVSANPLSQVPTEPRTHRHDSKKGQQHKVVANGGGLVSPANSSRYLLSGGAAAEEEIQEVESAPPADATKEEAADAKNTQAQEQVVVLKVSLHCKACAGKVKKHLSKMEGVKSFDIDFTAKKVTVIGDVTPLGVLNSVSKVKNAQLWGAPPPAIAA